jgi:preprotein translocase subunit YajC
MAGPATVMLAREFKKPITLAALALIVIIIVAIVRFMRRDKRAEKQKAKELERELQALAEKDKIVYPKAAEIYGVTERDARICDDVAKNINGAFGSGLLGNDDEALIIRQLNRLGGPKSIACADFFYKKYRNKSNPNIAYDSLETLNLNEWAQVKEPLREPLKIHARLKGEPKFDVYFFTGN